MNRNKSFFKCYIPRGFFRSILNISILFIVIGFILLFKISLFDNQSDDYIFCLSQWVKQITSLSIKDFLLSKISDYNIIYLYILFIISKIKIYDLYLIKLVSFFFDIILAWSISSFTDIIHTKKSENLKVIIFILVLALPTVILNSSSWAQCDVIYTTLVISGLYFALKNQQNISMVLMGLSLAFKLQSIFVLPIIIVLIIAKKIKIKHLFVFLISYLAPSVPQIIVGYTLSDYIGVYIGQIRSYTEMTLNAPSLWGISTFSYSTYYPISIIITLTIILIILAIVLKNKKNLNNTKIINLFFMFSLIVPYFLPKMHERYFYIAEVTSVIYMIANKKRWYFPLIIQFVSLNNYIGYLYKTSYIQLNIGAMLMGILVLITINDFISDWYPNTLNKTIQVR